MFALFGKVERRSAGQLSARKPSLAQPQDVDRDIVGAAALTSQFNQIVTRAFRALFFDRFQNLMVLHLSPQTVGADHNHIAWAQWLWPSGRIHDEFRSRSHRRRQNIPLWVS